MQYLVDQQPVWDSLIVKDIRPTDTWIGNVATGVWPAHQGVTRILDRMRHVAPNVTKVWNRTQYGGCLGHPCDKTENCITWGSERTEEYLEEQSWCTPLLCYDSLMHITHAKEQLAFIVSKILRPATSSIMSMFLRKSWLNHAGNHFVANRTMPQFTFAWALGGVLGDEEFFLDLNVAPTAVRKLVPQMLQRRWNPLMLRGYGGENPFQETGPFVEYVGGMETFWDMERMAGLTNAAGATPGFPTTNWRFTEWSMADKFWRYGFSGQLGNFQWRADPMELRFNYVGPVGVAPNIHRYQLILPYVNTVAAGAGGDPGLGSIDNPHFQTACFAISGVMHRKGLIALLMEDATPINSEMPFLARNWAGKWQFVMHDLGAAENGVVIENKRGNKGQFIADFKLGIRPEHPEFMDIFFHKREAMCIPEIDVCVPCEYPDEVYDSCAPSCP